jgi:MoxR-like ATPase
MHLINIPQMQGVVEHVVIGENEPAWFHGEPGCGKSQGIGGACKALDVQLIDFRLGQYDTVDFKGFPDIDRDTNTTVWHMASTLPFIGNPKFDPEKKKLVFLDEADHGKDSVKGVAYQLLQERRVGEHIIQPNTYFAAAGNRPKDRGVGGKSPPPLNNRCTHYEVGPDADVWVAWAGGQPRIPSELMAFLMFRKPLISTFDPKSPDPAFATPRSWEKVAHYDTNPNMPEDIKDASIEGAVGEGPAAEYAGFKKVICRHAVDARHRGEPDYSAGQ